MQVFTNNAVSTLASAITNSSTAITLTDGSKFPVLSGLDYFLLTLIGLNDSLNEVSWEIVKVTARAGNALTVVRAQEGTTAVSWPSATRTEARLTAGSVVPVDDPRFAAAQSHASNTTNPHGVTKTQVGLANVTNDAQLKIASNLSDVANVATSRDNLGLAIGSNVQAYDAGLNSIAGLTTVADRMLYATASDTYAVTPITAFGRSLIDDAAASNARTTLGLGTIATQAASNVAITGGSIAGITDLAVLDGGTGASTAANARTNLGLGTAATATVTTSATDTTANRLLKVGDFGVGAVNPSQFAGDLDTLVATGHYAIGTATNTPAAGPGVLMVMVRANIRVIQVFIAATGSSATDGNMYVRALTNTTWQPWREIYHQGSILGTVSQSAGVPTGAVIERGSNANGEYVRFADGTQICTRQYSEFGVAANTLVGGSTRSFPAAFAVLPTALASIQPAADNDHFGCTSIQNTTISECWPTIRNGPTAQTFTISLVVVGRWF